MPKAQTISETQYDYVCDLGLGSDEALHRRRAISETISLCFTAIRRQRALPGAMEIFIIGEGNAPLEDQNWTPKTEAVKYWMELTHDEWMPQLSDKTDENGEYNVRTHRGEYDVTVTAGGKTAKPL